MIEITNVCSSLLSDLDQLIIQQVEKISVDVKQVNDDWGGGSCQDLP